MSKKLYLLELGFLEDTVLYEVRLKEVSRYRGATLREVSDDLVRKGVVRLVIDNAHPEAINRLKGVFAVKKIIRFVKEKYEY